MATALVTSPLTLDTSADVDSKPEPAMAPAVATFVANDAADALTGSGGLAIVSKPGAPSDSAMAVTSNCVLVKETCALLKLSNVRIKDNSVLIKGDLGEYSVHLGSGIARKMPGATLFIVAVQAQHRGRLFLPFADNDPRTAEVVSKVLMLARDKEIKDPSIIQQIRAG